MTFPAARRFIPSAYIFILAVALAWTIGNCVYVYAVLDGAKVYRVETAVFVLLVAMLPLAVLPARRETTHVTLTRRGVAIVGAAAIAGWASLSVPSINYPFLSDDYVFLELFRHLGDINRQPEFFRPLFALVFWSLRTAFGAWPPPFHVLILALHAGSAFMVYRLCLRLFDANGPAVLAGSLFLVNPLQLEATLWVSGLQDVLWSFFVLAALTCYVHARELSLTRLVITCVLLACGLLSKETAAAFVLLLPAADLMFFGFRRGRRIIVAYAVLAGELIAYLLLRGVFKPMDATYFVAPTRYFVKQFVTTPYRFFIHPWNQAAVHVNGLVAAAISLAVLLLFAYSMWQRRRSSRIPAGAFVVLATTLPVYSYFYIESDLMASRYIYCAAAGWAIIVAELAATAATSQKLFVATGVVAIALGAYSLHLNARPWLVARDVVNSLDAASATGAGVDAELDRWRAMNVAGMTWKNGVPYACNGVGIFINGYDEFLKITREARRFR